MINLINIGYDIGDITVNAFNAIIESDIIINYDNIDLSSLETYIKDKEIIVRDLNQFDEDLVQSDDENNPNIKEDEDSNGLDEDEDSNDLDEDSIQLEDDSEEMSKKDPSSSIYSKLENSYSFIDLAISKSFDNNVVIVCSNNRNIHGISNLLMQISSKYKDVQLKVYPGVSPIDYASSILGAPLNDFIAINLNNPIVSQEELKNKINLSLKNDFIIFVYNLKADFISKDEENDNFNMLKELMNNFNNELLVGIVNNNSYEICQFKDIDEEMIDEDSTLLIGNKLTYELEDHMINSCDYIVEPKFISQNIDFFERYLKDETPKGLDYDCEYLPCHKKLEACDFCYCPFYPCADGITGGEWIKGKDIWSCQYCDWIHLEEPCQEIRKGLEDILKDKNDLKTKHIELLRLRRQCLLKTLK